MKASDASPQKAGRKGKEARGASPKGNRFRSLTWLWIGVAVLFVGNFLLLIFSGQPLADNRDVLTANLQEDTQSFERLAFWQRLISGRTDQDERVPSRFDGLPIDPDYEESVVSIMIDNFSLARQQHNGIRAASLVYEALVEGGITRLMLIFPYQETDQVGPVRSSRDYFVDYSEEYGGLYVHAGGSPSSLEKLWASERVYSLEEDERLEGETYSFRDLNYDPPHNLYFDLLLTRERADELGYEVTEAKKEWCFLQPGGEKQGLSAETEQSEVKEEVKSEEQEVQEEELNSGVEAVDSETVRLIELDFSSDPFSSYYVQFEYDAEQQTYRRYYGSQKRSPHIDQYDSLQVAPTNVIVQISPSFLIEGDEKERLYMDHIGEGKAFFYLGGKKKRGAWSKPTASSVTRFTDEEGKPFCLNPGQTWIALLDDEQLISEE